jgi:hypothetical protein
MLDRLPGQRLMALRACDIERIEQYDSDPDLSYLDPDADPDCAAQNAERLAAYRAGMWHCIAIKARATFLIGLGEAAVIQVVESPGLWGIESDSDPGYLEEVFRDEAETLRDMLVQLNVTVVDG